MNELQAQLQEVTDQLAQLDPNNRDNLVEIAGLEQKKAVLIMKMDDAKAQEEQQAAQQVRIQAQEEKVESITLPFDFDDIFENAKANEMIIELVKEYKRKDYEEHNAEIQTLTNAFKEGQQARQERELEMKRQIDELQSKWETEKEANNEAITMLNETKLRLNEIETNRANAVRQLEEAQAEIAQLKSWNDDLRAQAAHGVRKAIDIIDISPSEKLALMVKETNEQKANRGLARWAEIMPEVVAPPVVPAGTAVFEPGDIQAVVPADPMDETGFIPIPADHPEVTFRPEGEVQSNGVPVDPRVSSEDGSSAEAQTVTRYEFEALKADVEVLKRRQGMVA